LRGTIGGGFCGGAPRPSGAGSTRHDGGLCSSLRDCVGRSGALVEEAGEGSGMNVLYISLATSSRKRG
jgi:hypothetical protein